MDKKEFKIGDLVKVYMRKNHYEPVNGEVVFIQSDYYLVDVGLGDPEAFSSYEMELDLVTIRENKIKLLLELD